MIDKLHAIELEVLANFPSVLCTCVGIDTMHFLRFRLNEYQFIITICPACQLQISAYGVDTGEIKTNKPFLFANINREAALKRAIETIKEMSENE